MGRMKNNGAVMEWIDFSITTLHINITEVINVQ